MKKVVLILLFFCCFGSNKIMANQVTTNQFSVNVTQKDTNFYSKYFYWGIMDKSALLKDFHSKNLNEEFEVTFWLTFIFATIASLILLIRSNYYFTDEKTGFYNELYGFRKYYFATHFLMWLFLIFWGILLGNFGPGWFVVGGLASSVIFPIIDYYIIVFLSDYVKNQKLWKTVE